MRIHRRGAELNAMDEPVVEWGGQSESVILTRRRGDAEIGAEKQREGENERGDSGGTSPSVRRGRVTGEKTENKVDGRGGPRGYPVSERVCGHCTRHEVVPLGSQPRSA